jgi:hypothetical protein
LNLEGALQGLQPGLMQVVSEGGEPWLVKIEARGENVSYVATAHRSWLQPGMYVQLKGTFDRRGKAVAPLSQLTVFTPQANTQLGAVPEGGASGSANELFGEAKPQGRPKPKAQPDTYNLAVVGRVAGLDDARIRVAAGAAVVEAELADQAVISVEMNNYALARPGDKVSVNGWYLQKGQGIANRLLVRAAQPLGSPKKERGAASPKERGAASPKEGKQPLNPLDDLSAGDTATPAKEDGQDGTKDGETQKQDEND